MRQHPYKVLHLIDTLEMGGAQRIVYHLAVRANRSKYTPLVCSWEYSGPYRKIIEKKGIEVHTLLLKRRSIILFPLFFFDSICLISKLIGFIFFKRIDIIHTHLPDSSVLGVFTGRVLGRCVIITVHNNNIMPYNRHAPVRNWVRRKILNAAFRAADMVLAVGDDVRENVKNNIGAQGHVITVFNGVEYEKFQGPFDAAAVRDALGIPKDAKVAVCAGRLVPQKGQAYLIRAAAQLVKKFPTMQVLFLGDGPLRGELEKEARKMDIEKNIRFLGLRSDIPEIMAVSDAFVLPSFYEGIPLVVLEAMASGKPVVATNIEGTRELVSDNSEGFLVETANPVLLADRLNRIFSDPKLARKLGENGRQKVLRKFRLECMVDTVEAVYERLMKKS